MPKVDFGRNDLALSVSIDGQTVSHFRLREFENRDGLAMVHRSVVESLERVRRDLAVLLDAPVWIIITDAVRTPADLERLANRYGWIDEGGTVARHSKHLSQFGGIAVDLIAVVSHTRERVPQHVVGDVCRRYFDWVKDDYKDGHVHADNRSLVADNTEEETR